MVGAGILLLLSALRIRAQARTRATALYLASIACGGLGVIVWVPDNSLALDSLLHTPGVGHLLTIWLISLCFILQFAFMTALTRHWNRLSFGASVLYALLLGLFSLAWMAVHLTLGTRFGTMAYGAYAGGPAAVVIMHLAASLCTVWAALLGAWGYGRFLLAGHRLDERLGAGGALSVLIGGAVYGLIVLGNTLATSAGTRNIGLFTLRAPIIVISAALAPFTLWVVIHLQPLWMQLWAIRGGDSEGDLQHREEELFQLRLAMLDAQALLDDATARLQHFADPTVVEDVAARCPTCDLSPYEQRVAIEAAIWATAMRDGAGWIPWIGSFVRASPRDTGDPAQLRTLADDAHRFTADTLRVVLLVLGRRQMLDEAQIQQGSPGWRRRAAAVVRLVLRAHGYDRNSLLSRRIP